MRPYVRQPSRSEPADGAAAGGVHQADQEAQCEGRAVQVDPGFDRARFQRLKLKCDVTLSIFAFNFNLRRYTKEKALVVAEARWSLAMAGVNVKVGRCRLTASKPVLKVPTVSALETLIS